MADNLTILLALYSLQVMAGSLTVLGALTLGRLLLRGFDPRPLTRSEMFRKHRARRRSRWNRIVRGY